MFAIAGQTVSWLISLKETHENAVTKAIILEKNSAPASFKYLLKCEKITISFLFCCLLSFQTFYNLSLLLS